jgi:hypothetical protein
MFDALTSARRELLVNAAGCSGGSSHSLDSLVSVPLSRACSCAVFAFVSLLKQRVSFFQSHHVYDHTTTVCACDLLVARLSFVA